MLIEPAVVLAFVSTSALVGLVASVLHLRNHLHIAREAQQDLTVQLARRNRLGTPHASRDASPNASPFQQAVQRSMDAVVFWQVVRDGMRQPIDFAATDHNPKARELLGLNDARLRRLADVFGERLAPRLMGRYTTTLERGRAFEEEISVKLRDGRSLWLRQQVVPIPDGVAVTYRDITLERKAAQHLEQSKLQAEELNAIKSRFLANISHELRLPMTALLGWTDALLDQEASQSGPPVDRRMALATIRRNGQYLVDLVDDLLDLARIEAGRIDVERVPVAVPELLAEVIDLLGVGVDRSRVRLSLQFRTPLPERLVTDPRRLRQMLINLVGNAIRFTEVGSVDVVASLEADTDSRPHLRLDVLDTGPGLTDEQSVRIFLPFVQGSPPPAGRRPGTGLGLAISHQLAKLLGGELSVARRKGQGSQFTLDLPVELVSGAAMVAAPTMRPAIEGQAPKLSPLPARRRRVLVAEDGPDNQRVIRYLLDRLGIENELVENGRQAVDRILAAATGAPPIDLILMDMQMPELDGFEATRALRAAGYTGPIIALTARAMTGDRELCLQAGCTDYLAKPIDRNRFAELLCNA
jgi:signal transduction histidine kinase